jgi:superfamily II DNA/RNA helicase
MSFSSLGLSAHLIRALTESGYSAPTPIQAQAIPAVLAGGDVIASADTGSGKTAAYVLPILQELASKRRPTPRVLRALVLVPTRELAAQVGQSISRYGRHQPERTKSVVIAGGGSLNPQRMALRGGADIVVATPGRLLDLLDEKALSLASVSTLVLDEADKMLALGFADELGRLMAQLPARRQTVLVSATFPESVQALATKLLRTPKRIEIAPEPSRGSPAIEQRAIQVDTATRAQLLLHLLGTCSWSRALVFVATKYGADHVSKKLARAGIAASALHGDLSQGARTESLAAFKSSALRVVVATDVAARGIDIPQLACVVNYDLPRSPTDYLHRIGRTGRAGEKGTAITFLGPGDEGHFRLIERRHGLSIPRERIEGFEPTQTEAAAPSLTDEAGTGGIKGKRKSKKDKLREASAAEQVPDES